MFSREKSDGRGRGCESGVAGGEGAEKVKGCGRTMIMWARMDTEPNCQRKASNYCQSVATQYVPQVHTRNTPVMKPMAASVVTSSGGSMSALWLGGGGIVNCN